MTKKEAIAMFRSEVMPWIKKTYESDGIRDMPGRREAWNNFTDSLCKNGDITSKQYNTWVHPWFCD